MMTSRRVFLTSAAATAVGLTLALTACFAVISVIVWIIVATWRAIIGG